MILEVVKTIKIRGVGVFPLGTIFDSEKAPIPKEVKDEYKARTGSIIRHFPEVVEPEKELVAEATVPEKEPVPSPQVVEKAANEETKPSPQQVVRRKIRR